MDIRKLQSAIVDGLEDVKAQDIQVFNTEHLSPLFERVIVASGTSNRQVKALTASVRSAVREAGFQVMLTEGESNGEWIIVDCATAVVNLMQHAIRQYYLLEEIWGEKPVSIKLKSRRRKTTASEPMDEEEAKPATRKRNAAKAGADLPPVVKKVVARKTATAASGKKAPAKKVASKVASKKVAAKKAVSKTLVVNAPTKKVAAKQAPAKTVRKVAAKKAPSKTVAVKKVAAKKVAAKKAVRKAS